MRVCARSYCILLSHVQLISLGGLLFSEGKQRGSGGARGQVSEGAVGKGMNASQVCVQIARGQAGL